MQKKKLRTWQVKNKNKNRKYRTSLGITDYDIPMFGYKSALFIVSIIFAILIFVPIISRLIGLNYKLMTTIIGGIGVGFSVSYAQFFIEQKKGVCKAFWIVGILISLFVGLIILIIQ